MSDNTVAAPQPRTFSELIKSDGYKSQLAAALPRGVTTERMVRVVLTAINRQPKLLQCTVPSLWQSVLDCASLGLMPDALGRAYLVPYKDKCTLIIGYKGLIDLAYRSERIAMIQVGAVHKGDHWVYERGMTPKLEHRPADQDTTDASLTHVYSVVHLKDCPLPSIEVMTKREVDAIRKRSMSGNNGPWVTDYQEMAKKTVFRRHAKMLPMSAELERALNNDGDASVDVSSALTTGRNPGDDIAPRASDIPAEVVEDGEGAKE